MTIYKHHVAKAGVLLLILGMLSACGNVSRGVASDGQRADALVWPDVSEVTPIHKGGTFPNVDNLRKLRPGLDKQQVADLIGFPHFSEGVWGVREWNYVFNFHKGDDDTVTVCQFKILFDENKLARSFYWRPESCALEIKSSSPVMGNTSKLEDERFVLFSDALFRFNRASISDITDDGKIGLDNIAQAVLSQQGRVRGLYIAGYTDRLGTDAYNDDLSLKRAFAVKSYLTSKGIPPELIQAEGRGKATPVKDCPQSDRNSLIACLAPNRRVEVRVQLQGPSRGTRDSN